MSKRAILLVTHGSRSPVAKKEIIRLVKNLKRQVGAKIFAYAFLDVNQPSISVGIERCVKKGATEIIVLMNFLNSGDHALKDIPQLVRMTQKKFPHISMKITPPVGQHSKIPSLFLDMFHTAIRFRQ